MTAAYNIVGNILFSQSLLEIRQQLETLRKDRFDPLDRIVITQDIVDQYPYVDGIGTKLIEIQKIINQVDISNCFILLVTSNPDISREINFATRFYSIDPSPIETLLVDGNYKKTIKEYPNTACKKLWDHLYVGTDGNITPCCVADHRFPLGNIDHDDVNDIFTHKANQVRTDMTHGVRNRACAHCYEREDVGVRSPRQECDPADQIIRVRNLDIRLNNICNFKCRMCSEYFSSSIQQETIELFGKNALLGFEKISLDRTTKKIRDHRLEKILPLVTPELESIYFAGGEPLITSEHYRILDRLLEIQNTDLIINYNTNLSTLSYRQWYAVDQWCEFKYVNVGASIDASGKVAEYMRHGTVWQDIIDNIYIIKQNASHVKLKITSVVSSLTIENLINLQNTWIDQHLFSADDFQLQVLSSPNFLSPAALPQHHKARLGHIIAAHIDCFKGTELARQWQNVLTWMRSRDDSFALQDFANRTRVLDSHRNESFVEIFPEFRDLYEL